MLEKEWQAMRSHARFMVYDRLVTAFRENSVQAVQTLKNELVLRIEILRFLPYSVMSTI